MSTLAKFESGLIDHINGLTKHTAVTRRLKRVLARPKSNKRRQTIVKRIFESARDRQLMSNGRVDFDSPSFPWAALLPLIMAVIKAILELFDTDPE